MLRPVQELTWASTKLVFFVFAFLGSASLVAWPRLVALLLWSWLRSRGAHFAQPVCLVVTAALASLFVLSLKGGCGLALALCVVGRLPFGKKKPPW